MSQARDQDTAERRLKIDVVVHGRFHAFHLARALIARGHDVKLLTNYPRWAVRRFGIPDAAVRSFTAHGIATRLAARAGRHLGLDLGQPALHRMFGRWAASAIRPDADLVYIFSGVAEEAMLKYRGKRRPGIPSSGRGPGIWLARGSSHITTQDRLLREEEARVGTRIEKPSAWSIAREQREYALADRIVTLSKFSHGSFQQHADLAPKTILLTSAVDARRFRTDPRVVAERCSRIIRGEPLRILNVGAFSFRKGARDFVDLASHFRGRMTFRFVGDMPTETDVLRRQAAKLIEFNPRVPEFDLVAHYAWADLFVFPTIEDGFPAVVAQAQASGLVVITTPNGSGPDLVADGENGWLVPIRSPDLLMEKLKLCDEQRARLVEMTKATYGTYAARDWSAMACDLERHFSNDSASENRFVVETR